jgi:sugar lactone lactonase YvrE
VYIADADTSLIRKVTVSTGIITTVAGNWSEKFSGDGGQATSAGLNFPFGVAVDSLGNVYIADTFNDRIRKVTASTGIIDTIAGSGVSSFLGDEGTATSANLLYPNAAAVDSAGNIYIADTLNNRIRKVTVSTNVITTVAGSSTSTGYSGDGGAATSAELYYPIGVGLDSSGS